MAILLATKLPAAVLAPALRRAVMHQGARRREAGRHGLDAAVELVGAGRVRAHEARQQLGAGHVRAARTAAVIVSRKPP